MAKRSGRTILALITVFLLCMSIPAVYAADKGATKCTMTFTLKGWAAFYETASGSGTITCDNGQSSPVKIRAKGGGLSAGKYSRQGHGTFTEVSGIRALYGSYARAEAHAGAVKSATAQVLTKGSVSLSLTATGSGVDLGIGFGKFVISPTGKKSKE